MDVFYYSRTSVSGSLVLSVLLLPSFILLLPSSTAPPPSPPLLASSVSLVRLSPPVLSWACLPLGPLYFYSLLYCPGPASLWAPSTLKAC